MAFEIEHKYLVKKELWRKVVPQKSLAIKQGYLLTDPNKTIRVRVKGDKGYITIKGKSVGASRQEFEYEVPLADAEELFVNFSSSLIEKVRHIVSIDNKTWEVDVFSGRNEGLIIAEIELTAEDERYNIPDWVGENVTADTKYANSNLSTNPFTNW
jgi:adenylate cyclase